MLSKTWRVLQDDGSVADMQRECELQRHSSKQGCTRLRGTWPEWQMTNLCPAVRCDGGVGVLKDVLQAPESLVELHIYCLVQAVLGILVSATDKKALQSIPGRPVNVCTANQAWRSLCTSNAVQVGRMRSLSSMSWTPCSQGRALCRLPSLHCG